MATGTVPSDAAKKARQKAFIESDCCTGCQVCVAVCPVDCIDRVPGPVYDTLQATCTIVDERCIGCRICVSFCPWGAISMIPARQVAPVAAGKPSAAPPAASGV